jgi:hypothetical protein
MKLFRRLYLKSNQLAIVPELGYERVDNASDKAIKYMEWVEKRDGVKIQHAGNGREKCFSIRDDITGKIRILKVDGYEEKSNHVIEILGWYPYLIYYFIIIIKIYSYYHGCPKHTEKESTGANGKLARINYAETMERIERLQQIVSKVDYIWECQIDEELRKNQEMKEYFTDCKTKGRINPRDAVINNF